MKICKNLQAPVLPMSSKPGDDSDTHIQIILHCRNRSEREMQVNSPTIIAIESAKMKELTISTLTPYPASEELYLLQLRRIHSTLCLAKKRPRA